MKTIMENWREYQDQTLNEDERSRRRAGPLVYSADKDAAGAIKKARELDRQRESDYERAKREAMGVIDSKRAQSPALAFVLEELVEALAAMGAARLSLSKLMYYVKKAGVDTATRRLFQGFFIKFAVPGLGVAFIVYDIYEYFLASDSKEKRNALISDVKKIANLLSNPKTYSV